ncbi:RNA polymerase sigma-B factor [Mycobacterium sp. OAS707]|uniref:SigB/SigF/SigG family RNA polymerase sigma factor n=1 Tax=Mycobacterium sp. OAS707 TaxID=2663822 RepID=UPI001789153A|nr:SigB/SigF/SigG family RNA polymerase sigma factor [Mycobacterium sp. OAS707]MBE1552154.1 RNA polymerase sigma-B factor [Mycobacterium sp. OAS707]
MIDTTGPHNAIAEGRDDDYSQVEQWFDQLAGAGSEEEQRRWRCRIVSCCMPLADHIAYRFVGRGEPAEDLVQVARLGLVKAVDRYRPGAGRFLAFAVPTILGDLRRHFRDCTWGMHVPRSVKETHRRMRSAIDPLSQRLGRAPTATELAAELGVQRSEVVACIQAAYAYRPMSLDGALSHCDDGEQPPLSERHGAIDEGFERIDDGLTVAALVSELCERERTILAMRFEECLTQTQIAQRLGISQVHVSRLLGLILDHLRDRLAEEPPISMDTRLSQHGDITPLPVHRERDNVYA